MKSESESEREHSNCDYYYVEKILKKQTTPSLQYLIQWEGFDESQATWEPLSNLENVLDMVKEFEDSLSQPQIKKKGGRTSKAKSDSCSSKYSDPNDDEYEEEEEHDLSYKNKNVSNNSRNRLRFMAAEKVLESMNDDIPEKIITAKMINNKLHCLVIFSKRKDGIILDDAYVPSSELADKFPKLLLDFYESKIKFV